MKAWTDYPFTFLGDKPNAKAPIRECEVKTFDGDRRCKIVVDGHSTEVKCFYLYDAPGRCGEVSPIDVDKLRVQ